VTPISRVALVAMAAFVCAATPAFPQPTDVPPSTGGLFGAAHNRRFHDAIDLSLSVVEGYDSNVPPVRGIGPSEPLVSGGSTMFLGHMDYRWQGSRLQVAASGETALRQYTQAVDFNPASYSGGLGMSARLGGRMTLYANQTVAYSPSYLYGLFPAVVPEAPGATVPVAPDYAISNSESYAYATRVTLTRGLTRRNRLSATGEFDYTNFLHDTAARPDLNSSGVRGEYWHQLAPSTAITVGYGYRTGIFGNDVYAASTPYGMSANEHRVSVGRDYSRPLSATRRVSVAANVGSSIVNTAGSTVHELDPSQLVRLSSDVGVTWNFSRSWSARGTYRRGLEYVADLTEPVFADGFTAEFGGLCTSRIDIVVSARYSRGVSVVNRDALAFDTSGADLRLRYALTSALAVYGEYLYYFYDFRGNRSLAPGIPPSLERNAIRAGLTLRVRAWRR
jgi:hypothetical protein